VSERSGNPDKLHVLWTSGDREVALNMVFMYARNAKVREWWNEVALIIWGPSAALLSRDEELQREIQAMGEAGVELLACRACADGYGVTEDLEKLGLKVIYMGEPLTRLLKQGARLITF